MASDFEDFGWDQDDLDQIIGEIDLLSYRHFDCSRLVIKENEHGNAKH